MFGEKKTDIYELIPDQYLPATFLIPHGERSLVLAKAKDLGYPCIAKPNIGERGVWVEKIDNEEQLRKYAENCPADFLLQEFVTHPLELGIFYVRFPGADSGKITSIVRKDFLKVVGDGKSTVQDLLMTNERALLTANLSSPFLRAHGDDIPSKGETVLIEPIGNHCRGTRFLSDQKQINEELSKAIDSIAQKISGFHFGRFDLRCPSYKHLVNLQQVKILELNGAGAEPGHIYQPGFSLFKAYRIILWHLKQLATISLENHKKGVPYWNFKKGYEKWRLHNKYNRILAG